MFPYEPRLGSSGPTGLDRGPEQGQQPGQGHMSLMGPRKVSTPPGASPILIWESQGAEPSALSHTGSWWQLWAGTLAS